MRGMKQRELARKMDVKQQRISALENGPQLTAAQIQKACIALNLSKKEVKTLLKLFTPPLKKRNKKEYNILLNG